MSSMKKGFTLLEILVSIVLMVILMSAVTLIFLRSTETVTIANARTTVYTNARYALETLEADLLGCFSFKSGQQHFVLENGRTAGPTAGPITSSPGFHVGQAADMIMFRTTTQVGNTTQAAHVQYHLIPGNMALPPPSASPLLPIPCGALVPGDASRGQTTRPPIRGLYTLVRRVRVQNPATGAWDQVPVDSSGLPIPDADLCYFVISFNIEYFSQQPGLAPQFSQIDSSPCPPTDPLGNGDLTGGTNDGGPPGSAAPMTAYRIPYIRITLVIVEDVGVRQERQFQETFWIPMG